jgi:hypothetical protein
MKKSLFVLAVAAYTGIVIANEYDTKAYCKDMSEVIGGSYLIEKSCRDQEMVAKAQLARLAIPSEIEKYCDDMGEFIGGSYVIKQSCVKEEMTAKDALKDNN